MSSSPQVSQVSQVSQGGQEKRGTKRNFDTMKSGIPNHNASWNLLALGKQERGFSSSGEPTVVGNNASSNVDHRYVFSFDTSGNLDDGIYF